MRDDTGGVDTGVGRSLDTRSSSLRHTMVVRARTETDPVLPLTQLTVVSPPLMLTREPVIATWIVIIQATVEASDGPPVSFNLTMSWSLS